MWKNIDTRLGNSFSDLLTKDTFLDRFIFQSTFHDFVQNPKMFNSFSVYASERCVQVSFVVVSEERKYQTFDRRRNWKRSLR